MTLRKFDKSSKEIMKMVFDSWGKKIRHQLFDAMVNGLKKSARLEQCHKSLSFGGISWFDNGKKTPDEAEALVMIHGLGADKNTWLQLAKHLTRGYRLIIPDLPGHGDSTRNMELNYGAEEQAQRLAELCQHLNINQAHFVGSSMGGAVATRLAHLRPSLAKSLILIDSYGVVKTESALQKIIEETGSNPVLNVNTRNDYRKLLSLTMAKPPAMPDFIIDTLTENVMQNAAINQKIYADSEIEGELTPILPTITVPVMLIWGNEDKVLHVDNAKLFAKALPNCSTVIMENIGHVPMVEDPRTTADHIVKYLDEKKHV